ncbi:MAG: hypothetical protein CME06_04955 [Gemmatimonadetes bacterium]|nr:hypothetical protein [Gemmatimonadota bacterium]
MGERWIDEMQQELERWQAIQEEARNPKDFLIADPDYRDVVVGTARYLLDAIRYWVLCGTEPSLPLKMQIDTANIYRQIGPARLKEQAEWLKATATPGDPFEGLLFDDE